MDDRTREIETASGAASLGRLADQVALAAIRRKVGRQLDDNDLSALDDAAALLDEVASINSTAVAPTPALLHAIAPVGVIDETVDAVTSSASERDATQVEQRLREMAEDTRALKVGKADDHTIERIHAYFDRLSRITLARAAQLASRRTGDNWWTQEALNYLTS